MDLPPVGRSVLPIQPSPVAVSPDSTVVSGLQRRGAAASLRRGLHDLLHNPPDCAVRCAILDHERLLAVRYRAAAGF